jgi:hypothetical protein
MNTKSSLENAIDLSLEPTGEMADSIRLLPTDISHICCIKRRILQIVRRTDRKVQLLEF